VGTRHIWLFVACACALGPASPASAALFYDPFNYPVAGRLSGQTNTNVEPPQTWAYVGTGLAGTLDPTIGDGSLSYPDFAAPSGNSVLTDRTQAGSARVALPAPITSGRVYYSMLVRVNDMTNIGTATTGSFFAGLNSGTGGGTNISSAGAPLLIRAAPGSTTEYQLGIGAGNLNPDRTWDTTSRTADQTLLVVGAYEFNPAADDDVAYLWINPAPETFGADTAPTPHVISNGALSVGTASDIAQVASFFLRNNGVEPQQIQVDELRMDTTWAGEHGECGEQDEH
jgi:hypothetical protein